MLNKHSQEKFTKKPTRKRARNEEQLASGHRARKRFGQNFLHDTNIINRIIDSVNVSDEHHVLEIGPGQGALTADLLQASGRFDAVELDRDLAAMLSDRFGSDGKMKLHQQDILKFDLASLNAQANSLRVVGNLPYNISTPVIFYLLANVELIQDMTFMLQLEVVERMAAKPGSKNFGRLSLMVQYHCNVEHLFNVPSDAFIPKPKVCSAIVRLTPHRPKTVTVEDYSSLDSVVRTLFNQRRKTLRKSLRAITSEEVIADLAQQGIDSGLRPETLTLAQFAAISNLVYRAKVAAKS